MEKHVQTQFRNTGVTIELGIKKLPFRQPHSKLERNKIICLTNENNAIIENYPNLTRLVRNQKFPDFFLNIKIVNRSSAMHALCNCSRSLVAAPDPAKITTTCLISGLSCLKNGLLMPNGTTGTPSSPNFRQRKLSWNGYVSTSMVSIIQYMFAKKMNFLACQTKLTL